MSYPTNDVTAMMGIGNYDGEIRRGPDRQLYEWNESVDGLGNPIGFWSALTTALAPIAAKAAGSLAKRALPWLAKRVRPIISRGLDRRVPKRRGSGRRMLSVQDLLPLLRRIGIAGVEGEIMQGPDGRHWEKVEGIGEFGQRRTMLRPVRLIIPAHIKTRGYGGSTVTPILPGTRYVRTPPRAVPKRRVRRFRRFR